MLPALIEALRPHQWVKNLLVLAPLFFAHKLGDTDATLQALGAFATFCLLASSIYLLNDLVDREEDQRHPTKCERPLASGRLAPAVAWTTIAIMVPAVLSAAWFLGPRDLPLPFIIWPAAYFLMNLAYSFRLKRMVIVDCLCIALGFQFRVHAGSVVIGVHSSKWILLCTFFFALFLAFCKRRDEVARHGDGTTRSTIRDYSLPYLDQLIAPLAALSILTYALYTVDDATTAKHGEYLLFTVPFVVFGVFRYLFLVHHRGQGGDPSRQLFRDKQLMLSAALWIATAYAALKFG